jgi:hypothetical protein
LLKKTAAILLLGILLFNWVGYRFLTSYLEDKTNQQFNAQLDNNNYDESDLISIKVVNHLPYTNSKEFERVNGQIEIAGIQYNYVKMRVAADSLELLCIPNHEVTKMQASKDEFFKLVNDLQRNSQDKKTDNHSGASKIFSIDFYTTQDLLSLDHPDLSAISRIFQHYSFLIPSCYSPIAEQPPDIC